MVCMECKHCDMYEMQTLGHAWNVTLGYVWNANTVVCMECRHWCLHEMQTLEYASDIGVCVESNTVVSVECKYRGMHGTKPSRYAWNAERGVHLVSSLSDLIIIPSLVSLTWL